MARQRSRLQWFVREPQNCEDILTETFQANAIRGKWSSLDPALEGVITRVSRASLELPSATVVAKPFVALTTNSMP